MMSRVRKSAILVAVLLTPAWLDSDGAEFPYEILTRPVPANLEELRAIEGVVTGIAAKVVPCTVGVQVGNNHGSGVVISSSGLVLTAAHVATRPGRSAVIRFPDGSEAKATTLGMNLEADGALIQIDDEGNWPWAPLVTLEDYPRPGDWCVATGHPGGFDPERSPPVRLGRVIDVDRYVLRTDCTINSGDSGGPLFDMQGRVIGIHSRIAEQATVNLHGPVLEYLECWEQMKAGEVYPPRPDSRFLSRLDADGDGTITRAELADETHQRIYDRLVERFELDQEKAYTIQELKDRFGWRNTPVSLEIAAYEPSGRPGQTLPRNRFVRGNAVRSAFESLVDAAPRSLVEILHGDERVSLGTVVEGGVVTKASELPETISCKTADGQQLPVEVIKVDKELDLALLQVPGLEAPPLAWGEAAETRTGSWLVTPGLESRPLSIGVVSVAERQVSGMPPVLGIVTAVHEAGVLVTAVPEGGGAHSAGLQADDVIVEFMGQAVHSLEELRTAISHHHPGEVVKLLALRGDERMEFQVRLGTFEDVFAANERFGSGRLNGQLNERRNNFPLVIQHDSVLQPNECGGPVLDTSGRVVGINIARADRVGTYALPAQLVRQFLESSPQE